MNARISSPRRRSRRLMAGAAAVELAMLIGPLATMTFAATELGRAIYTFNLLDKSLRDAVRHLSQQDYSNTAIQTEVRCLAVYGSTTCGTSPVASGLTTSMVTLCTPASCASTHKNQSTGSGTATINLVSVSISGYTFTSLASFVVPNMTYNSLSATMRVVS